MVDRNLRLATWDRGSGPALVFLHGLAGFKELWAEILPPLWEAGFRTVAFDQRGHGESGDLPGPWRIADLADDMNLLLNQLGIARACLVGHSMGGRVMFQFALERPERVWALVSVAAQSEAPQPPYRAVLQNIREETRLGGLDAFRKAFERAGEIPERNLRDPVFRKRFDHFFSRNRTPAILAALDAILEMPNLTTRLVELRAPALALVGERDVPFLDLASHYKRSIPDCRTVVIPDCYHYPMTDQPDAFTETLLKFLRKQRRLGRSE